MKGPLGAAASAVLGFWLPIMLDSKAGGTDVAGQAGCRMKAEDGRLSLWLAL